MQSARWAVPKDLRISQTAAERLEDRLSDFVAAVREVRDEPLPGPEAIHQLRVTSRRGDAVIRALRGVLPADDRRAWLKVLRKVRKRAGKARDLDIVAERTGSSEQAPEKLGKAIQRERERLARWLDHLLLPDPRGRWSSRAIGDQRAFQRQAAIGIRAATRDLEVLADVDCSLDSMHTVRRRGKRLRFTLEFFEPALPECIIRNELPRIRDLLDSVGDMCDAAVMADHGKVARKEKTAGSKLDKLTDKACRDWKRLLRQDVLGRIRDTAAKLTEERPLVRSATLNGRAGSSVG